MSMKKILLIFWSVIFLGIIIVVSMFYLISIGKLGYMPTFEELENPNNYFASELYYEDGEIMSRYFERENRKYMEYDEIPASVIETLLVTEDVRFYDHSGIDLIGLFRVVKGLVTGNTSAGGGSTITQQLAKMLFPREANMSTFSLVFRKFREWVIAVRLEKSYTKEEILTMYLNKYDFLNLAVGINSAAEIYFNTSVDSLRLEQSAMLVGMAKNSSYFNPLRRPELTQQRRNVVLHQLYKYGKVSRTEYDSLKMLPLGLDYHKVSHQVGAATYFREYLRQYMTAKKPTKSKYRDINTYSRDSLAWYNDPLYGWCNKNLNTDGTPYNIYADGLRIYSTIDSRMQQYAEEAVHDHLSKDLQPQFNREKNKKRNAPFSDDITPEQIKSVLLRSMAQTERYRNLKKEKKSDREIWKAFEKKIKMQVFTWNGMRDTLMSPLDSIKHYKAFFRSGFMVMDPRSAHVKAYVGGPDYRYFMYDMVSVGKRQVGSTIKPMLYTLAMQEGMTPCDKVPNVPQTFILPTGQAWTARGGEKHKGEMVTLKWGLSTSENNISGWVMKQFTPQALADMAHKMGIHSRIDPVPAAFLGTAEATVKEMVSAYSVFANKGVYQSPLIVSRIEDKYGNVLEVFDPESRDVITENTAYLMCNLLQGVVNGGTAIRLRYKYGLKNPMGGKTGTTQAHADGWYMGMTPELVGGVWVGAEDRSIHFQNLTHGQGANMALPIWGLFLQKVYADKTLGVELCDFTRPIGFDINLDCTTTKAEKTPSSIETPVSDEENEIFY